MKLLMQVQLTGETSWNDIGEVPVPRAATLLQQMRKNNPNGQFRLVLALDDDLLIGLESIRVVQRSACSSAW